MKYNLISLTATLLLFTTASQDIRAETQSKPKSLPFKHEKITTFESLFSKFKEDNVPCEIGPIGPWMESETCGLNCAFMMLKLSGHEVDYQSLSRSAGKMPKGGLSLAEIKELCGRFDLECDVLKCNFDDLVKLPAPAIVHQGETDKPGHYVCFANKLSAGPNSINTLVFIDGTTATVSNIPQSSLEINMRDISGFVLVPRTGQWEKWNLRFLAFLSIMLFLLIVDHQVRNTNNRIILATR